MWEEISLSNTLIKNSVGRKNQINASAILPSGKYPVIDQGQAFVAGYCDDANKLVKDELPFVIFGDHTRCFKFVDFPFILGADGTKVLKPNSKLFDPKFYYFALLSLDVPNRGYNRHFKLLKEIKIPKPELPEQQRIAYVLSTVQTAIEQQARLIKITRELKSALMHKLFTEGLRGEKQKMTEIGPVPESWEVVPLKKAGDVIYGIQAAVANNFQPIGMKILTNKNITLDGQIVLDEINYFELKTKRHFETVLQKGDILFNWRSGSKDHIGKTAYFNLDGEYTHSSFILRIRPNDRVNGRFFSGTCIFFAHQDTFFKNTTYHL